MCHVLVIEDDWYLASDLAERALSLGGDSVSMAATQQDAVTQARAQRPDIILSDVELLDGTGPLAVETIIADGGDIPVIFITGNPESCRPCEAPHVILTKPLQEKAFARLFIERTT